MNRLFIICGILLASCSSIQSIPRIEEIPTSKDIIVNYYWNNEDSLEVYIPYTFSLHNNSIKKILFKEISIWDSVKDHDFKYFDESGNSLRYLNDISGNYISPKSNKVIYVYTKIVEDKSKIPIKYWKGISKEEMLKNKNQFPSTNAENLKLDNWKKRRVNDTISFRFYNTDENDVFVYYSLKTKKTKVYTSEQLAQKYLNKKQ